MSLYHLTLFVAMNELYHNLKEEQQLVKDLEVVPNQIFLQINLQFSSISILAQAENTSQQKLILSIQRSI